MYFPWLEKRELAVAIPLSRYSVSVMQVSFDCGRDEFTSGLQDLNPVASIKRRALSCVNRRDKNYKMWAWRTHFFSNNSFQAISIKLIWVMFNFYIVISSILILTSLVFGKTQQTVSILWSSVKLLLTTLNPDWGICYRKLSSYKDIISTINNQKSRDNPSRSDNYEVWLNERYLEPNGRSELIPGTTNAMNVYVKYHSGIDGYKYRIKCPNTFYWPQDTSTGNTFYISLWSTQNSPNKDNHKPIEYVDISKICLYQSLDRFGT